MSTARRLDKKLIRLYRPVDEVEAVVGHQPEVEPEEGENDDEDEEEKPGHIALQQAPPGDGETHHDGATARYSNSTRPHVQQVR